MLEASVNALEVRRRLRNPVNGRQSSELDVVSGTQMRRRRAAIAHEEARLRAEAEIDLAIQRALEAQEQARAEQEAARTAAIEAGALADDAPIPVIPKLTDIVTLVCERYRISRVDLLSQRRTANIVLPRQIAMYLARKLTTLSLPQIGQRMGGKDHTTVLHSYRKVSLLVENSPQLSADVLEIEAELRANR